MCRVAYLSFVSTTVSSIGARYLLTTSRAFRDRKDSMNSVICWKSYREEDEQTLEIVDRVVQGTRKRFREIHLLLLVLGVRRLRIDWRLRGGPSVVLNGRTRLPGREWCCINASRRTYIIPCWSQRPCSTPPIFSVT
jgi:hypothetical protein